MTPFTQRHKHGHGEPAGHSHALAPDADRRRLALALGLIVVFMVAEVVVGVLASSLALLSDAGHMLTDAGALGLSLMAMRWARRPPTGAMTFGLKRTEILAAQVNGITLLLIALVITFEAVRRLISPPQVEGAAVLAVALAGIAVNLAAAHQVSKANRQSLNVEGSFQHILTDLYAFIGTAIAGVVILTTGFLRADAIASLIVAGLMYRAGWALVKASGRIFLETAPEGVEPQKIVSAMLSHDAVANVHDFHLWEVTSGFAALSAHVLVHLHDDCHATRLALEDLLRQRFDIEHTTLQVDHDESERLLSIDIAERSEPVPRGDF